MFPSNTIDKSIKTLCFCRCFIQLLLFHSKRVWVSLSGDSDLREAAMVVLKLNDKYESAGDGRLIDDLESDLVVMTFPQS